MDETEAPLVPEMPTEQTDTKPQIIADGKGGRRRAEPVEAPVVPDLR